jgi:hypothetical protein
MEKKILADAVEMPPLLSLPLLLMLPLPLLPSQQNVQMVGKKKSEGGTKNECFPEFSSPLLPDPTHRCHLLGCQNSFGGARGCASGISTLGSEENDCSIFQIMLRNFSPQTSVLLFIPHLPRLAFAKRPL